MMNMIDIQYTYSITNISFKKIQFISFLLFVAQTESNLDKMGRWVSLGYFSPDETRK